MATTSELLGEIASILNGLPDVFSTAQWGGRAYKLPGPNGSRKKPKLLAFVSVTKGDEAVDVVFKLPKDLSNATVERFGWIERFEFGNWKNAGWIRAELSDGRQLRTMKRLLGECRAMFPTQDVSPASPPGRHEEPRRAGMHPIVRRMDRVMAEAKKDGWRPREPHEDDDVRE